MREMEIAMRGDCFSKTRGLIQNNLLGVMIASALMIPVTAIGKVIDIDDVGNEVVGPIDSIVRILNLRSCITDAEYKEMASEARALYQQLLRDIADVIEIDSRPETKFAVGALDRAGPRIKGFQDRLSRLLKELNSFPRCAPGVVPETRVGWFIGGHFVKSWQDLRSAEVRAATGQVTNQFSDNKDPLGFGIVVGAKFTPWSNSIVVGPFVSLDYLNMSVNHNFAGGSFLGTTSNYAATAGVKLGPTLPIGAWVYGIAGE